MDDSTLKPQAYASKDKATYDYNVAYLASIILFNNLHDNSEATDTDTFGDSSDIAFTDLSIFDSSEVSNTDSMFSISSDIASTDLSIFDSPSEVSNADSIFNDSSDITSTDSSIFDSSDASSIMDSSVFIDCSI